jgi:hypothetical protein
VQDHPATRRLSDVVVRAELEAEHAVDLLAPRGQQNDGDHPRLVTGPHLLQDLDPGQLWEHPIQDDEVGRFPAEELQGGDAVARQIHLETFFGKHMTQQVGYIALILDYEQTLHHASSRQHG